MTTDTKEEAFHESTLLTAILGLVLLGMNIIRTSAAGAAFGTAFMGSIAGAAIMVGLFFVVARMFLRARVVANGGDATICWNVAMIAYLLLYASSWIVIGV